MVKRTLILVAALAFAAPAFAQDGWEALFDSSGSALGEEVICCTLRRRKMQISNGASQFTVGFLWPRRVKVPGAKPCFNMRDLDLVVVSSEAGGKSGAGPR